MEEAKFSLYQIVNYECMWGMGNAVVSANSEQDALSLLEEYLRFDPNIKESLHGQEDIEFRVRKDGRVTNSSVMANKREVIFPFKGSI